MSVHTKAKQTAVFLAVGPELPDVTLFHGFCWLLFVYLRSIIVCVHDFTYSDNSFHLKFDGVCKFWFEFFLHSLIVPVVFYIRSILKIVIINKLPDRNFFMWNLIHRLILFHLYNFFLVILITNYLIITYFDLNWNIIIYITDLIYLEFSQWM